MEMSMASLLGLFSWVGLATTGSSDEVPESSDLYAPWKRRLTFCPLVDIPPDRRYQLV